jgi:hypothetical protein
MYDYYSPEDPNQSKPRASCSPEINLINLHFLRSYSKYLTMRRQQRCARKGRNAKIHPGELKTPWIYYEKFLTDMQFLFRLLPFTVGEDDNLEGPTQEQEERHTMTIDFEFHRGLKNSVTTSQAVVRQPTMTNPIDSPARPPTRTPSMTT